MEENSVDLDKKLEHIRKMYELFFSSNNLIRQQAFTLRGWCITLLIASIGFFIKEYGISPIQILFLLAIFIPTFFCLLEGFLELNCSRLKKHMGDIDKIFQSEKKGNDEKSENGKKQKSLAEKVNDFKFPILKKREKDKPKRCFFQELFSKGKEYLSALFAAYHLWTWYLFIAFMSFIFLVILYVLSLLNVHNADLLR